MPALPSLQDSARHRDAVTAAFHRLGASMIVVSRALAVAAALVSTSSAAPAAAVEAGPTWDIAAPDGPHGSDRSNYDCSADPGERIEDAVLVANTSNTPIALELYAADAFTTDAGQLDIRTRNHTPAHVGAWLTLGVDRVVLQAGERVEVPFAISVPDDAAGEYVGAVVTSAPDGSAPIERRAAILVRLHVGHSLTPDLSIEDMRVDYSGAFLGDGEATVTYTIRNSGDAVLAAGQSVSVAGPFDLARVEADEIGQTPALLPGETWQVAVTVDGVAALGPLVADVRAVPLYTDPAGSTGPLDPVDAVGSGWATPWAPALVACGLVVLVVLVAIVLRRRHA